MENFNYQTLLKLEKMNKESGAPTIFNIIQDSLRDLRTTRKIIKINEDSKSTVMTENQEIHISESTVDSDDEKTIQIPLSDEKDKQIPNRTQPKIKSTLTFNLLTSRNS